MKKGVVWIAGASSGLGLSVAKAFAGAGWQVIAGARSFDGQQGNDDGITRLHLDVTKADSAADFAKQALYQSPRVDALVYCAGLLVMGPCEEIGAEHYEKVMETNFIGMTRLVSSVLPTMRAQKSGRLMLFSSINGLLGIPFQSAYTASKHAIEGYAECLKMELKPYGIGVSLIEPGDHRGGSQHTRLLCQGDASPYHGEEQSAVAAIRRDEAHGLSPDRLGQIVLRKTQQRRCRFRIEIAKPDQRLAVLIHRFTPPCLGFAVLRSYYTKGGNQ